jgi:hypothetical protein
MSASTAREPAIRHYLLMLGLVLFVSAGVLGGCSAMSNHASSSGGQRFVDENGWRAEYASAAAALKLPPGVVFRKRPDSGGAASFEVGCGTNLAQAYWLHAWEKEWLAQRKKDAKRERAAFRVLTKQVPSSHFMASMDEGGKTLFAEYVKKAELGDPSGFQEDVDANPIDLQLSAR